MKKYIPNPGVPNPTPAPGANKGDGTVKPPRYVGKPVPVPSPTPKPKPKPKRSKVSDEEIMPKKFPKPKGNRRRLLDATNKMNKEAGY